MNTVYVGAALHRLGAARRRAGPALHVEWPDGVAKSLALIDQTVGADSVARSELPAKDRFVRP